MDSASAADGLAKPAAPKASQEAGRGNKAQPRLTVRLPGEGLRSDNAGARLIEGGDPAQCQAQLLGKQLGCCLGACNSLGPCLVQACELQGG